MPPQRTVFVDTAYLVGLIDPRDSFQARAREIAAEFGRSGVRAITTDAVLVEVGNYFCASNLRRAAGAWVSTIRADGRWEVVSLDPTTLLAAEARYRRFDDKNWSMTDCISMEVMERRRIREVATSDSGFSQAGFTILLT